MPENFTKPAKRWKSTEPHPVKPRHSCGIAGHWYQQHYPRSATAQDPPKHCLKSDTWKQAELAPCNFPMIPASWQWQANSRISQTPYIYLYLYYFIFIYDIIVIIIKYIRVLKEESRKKPLLTMTKAPFFPADTFVITIKLRSFSCFWRHISLLSRGSVCVPQNCHFWPYSDLSHVNNKNRIEKQYFHST